MINAPQLVHSSANNIRGCFQRCVPGKRCNNSFHFVLVQLETLKLWLIQGTRNPLLRFIRNILWLIVLEFESASQVKKKRYQFLIKRFKLFEIEWTFSLDSKYRFKFLFPFSLIRSLDFKPVGTLYWCKPVVSLGSNSSNSTNLIEAYNYDLKSFRFRISLLQCLFVYFFLRSVNKCARKV